LFTLAKKLAPICAAAAMVAATLAPGGAPAHAASKFNLTIYTFWDPTEVGTLQSLANGWAAQNGGTVRIVHDAGKFQDFITLAHSGKAPDAIFGIPDDNIGTFVQAGLVAPVPAGAFDAGAVVPPAVQAVTLRGKQYAVPLMFETYTLVYNKKLIPAAPKTFESLLATASTFPNSRGKNYGFLYDVTNFYYAYSFIRGFGGYVFKPTNNGLDVNDIGLGNAGTIKAFTFFQSLVQRHIIPADVTYAVAQGLFQKGQLAAFIDGSWDIAANRKALGSNFAAAPLPTLSGAGAPRPFAGVQVGFVAAGSQNKVLTFSLLKYMAAHISTPDNQASGRLPVRTADLNSSAFKKDPIVQVYATQALAGDTLPNVPEMSTVWTPGLNAISLVITGKSTPSAAAANLLKAVRQSIAQQNQ